MNRIVWAFRAFFALLFSGKLPHDLVAELGLSSKPAAATPSAPTAPAVKPADGALQLLGILQRDDYGVTEGEVTLLAGAGGSTMKNRGNNVVMNLRRRLRASGWVSARRA